MSYALNRIGRVCAQTVSTVMRQSNLKVFLISAVALAALQMVWWSSPSTPSAFRCPSIYEIAQHHPNWHLVSEDPDLNSKNGLFLTDHSLFTFFSNGTQILVKEVWDRLGVFGPLAASCFAKSMKTFCFPQAQPLRIVGGRPGDESCTHLIGVQKLPGLEPLPWQDPEMLNLFFERVLDNQLTDLAVAALLFGSSDLHPRNFGETPEGDFCSFDHDIIKAPPLFCPENVFWTGTSLENKTLNAGWIRTIDLKKIFQPIAHRTDFHLFFEIVSKRLKVFQAAITPLTTLRSLTEYLCGRAKLS